MVEVVRIATKGPGDISGLLNLIESGNPLFSSVLALMSICLRIA